MNIQQLKENSEIHPTLIDEVINQFGGWDEFTEAANDVYHNGITGGFGGFIYYWETSEFFDNNREYITLEIEDFAEECGTNIIDYIHTQINGQLEEPFTNSEIAKILYTKNPVEYSEQLKCWATWFAAESVCNSYCRILEESN